MSQYKSIEEYAAHVRQVTSEHLTSLFIELGPMHPASVAFGALLSDASGIVHGAALQTEQSEGYDLGALVAMVNPAVASNSECPFENE